MGLPYAMKSPCDLAIDAIKAIRFVSNWVGSFDSLRIGTITFRSELMEEEGLNGSRRMMRRDWVDSGLAGDSDRIRIRMIGYESDDGTRGNLYLTREGEWRPLSDCISFIEENLSRRYYLSYGCIFFEEETDAIAFRFSMV